MKNSKPLTGTRKLLKSLKKARADRKAGKASPVFSTVKEMKDWFEKWFEAQDVTVGIATRNKGKIKFI